MEAAQVKTVSESNDELHSQSTRILELRRWREGQQKSEEGTTSGGRGKEEKTHYIVFVNTKQEKNPIAPSTIPCNAPSNAKYPT